MPDQCDNCDYVRTRVYGEKSVLECRFPVPRQQGVAGAWPQVAATDWCGEYQILGFSDPANLTNQSITLTTVTKTKVIETDPGYTLWIVRGSATNTSINKGVVIKFFDGDSEILIGVISLAAGGSQNLSGITRADTGSVWAQLETTDGSEVYVYLQGKRGRPVEITPAEA